MRNESAACGVPGAAGAFRPGMNLHEYQAKQLLASFAVPTPSGGVADSAEAARAIAAKLLAAGAERVILKAQVHAGGRSQGVFSDGRRGAVRLCSRAEEVGELAQAMLGRVLVTPQTGPAGKPVSKVLVETAATPKRELYLAVLVDSASDHPMVLAGASGGMALEEAAACAPGGLLKEPVEPSLGLMPFQARRLAWALGLEPALVPAATKLFQAAYRTWWECDATLVEINPLGVVAGADANSTLLALDAKITLDDNALWRHPDLRQLRDPTQDDPLESEASGHSLSYVKLDGDIACVVNGAGLAMATMDLIKTNGGRPANFLDVGGAATAPEVAAAFRLVLRDPKIRAILVNVFGGIVQCDLIAAAIISAAAECHPRVPLIVRLEGNQVEPARQLLQQSGLPIITADSMADAARRVVMAAAAS